MLTCFKSTKFQSFKVINMISVFWVKSNLDLTTVTLIFVLMLPGMFRLRAGFIPGRQACRNFDKCLNLMAEDRDHLQLERQI